MRKLRHLMAASAAVLSLTITVPSASAQWTVFDPTNFSQNVLTAARELQQINNQIQMLTNQAQSLVNQAKNLANLPLSTLTEIQSSIAATKSLIDEAHAIAFDVKDIEDTYSKFYGTAAASGTTTDLFAAAETRWQNSVGAFEDSLKVQAGVIGNIPANSSAMSSLVAASQSATGALQAAQAGNQLLALQSQQLSDLIAVLSAKARADALEQARIAASEAEAKQQYKTFSTRTGYVPSDITMFTGK
jgi:P-type conjugative transfer protein TrbJ